MHLVGSQLHVWRNTLAEWSQLGKRSRQDVSNVRRARTYGWKLRDCMYVALSRRFSVILMPHLEQRRCQGHSRKCGAARRSECQDMDGSIGFGARCQGKETSPKEGYVLTTCSPAAYSPCLSTRTHPQLGPTLEGNSQPRILSDRCTNSFGTRCRGYPPFCGTVACPRSP